MNRIKTSLKLSPLAFCLLLPITLFSEPALSFRQQLYRTLPQAGLTENDFTFKKDILPDPNLSPLVKTLLDDPLQLPVFAESLENKLQLPPWESSSLSPDSVSLPFGLPAQFKKTLSPKLVKPLAQLLNELWPCQKQWEVLFNSISETKKQNALAAFAVENFHLEKNPTQKKIWSQTIKDQKISHLLEQIDKQELEETDLIQPQLTAAFSINPVLLRKQSRALLIAIYHFTQTVNLLLEQDPTLADFDILRFRTPLGPLYLAGNGPHQHDNEAAILIDFGGNDTYVDSGYAQGLANQPFRLVIDLQGDDLYQGQTASGIFGVGMVWDESGDDHYYSFNASLGCGLFGAGLLVDREGDDFYRGDTLSQGAGVFGYGLLLDESGNDRYQVALQGQGFAGVNGLGMLLDYEGDDYYKAGGKYPDYDRFPSRTLSLSQGFSMGYRPFAPGGLGILYDQSGNDQYWCDVFGQGCSYWYSCGALIDEQGDDSYESYQYAQGSGIHLSAGLLKDKEGNDRYKNDNGLAQGCAHDFAVGMLWDSHGDDNYESCDSSQGCAINNAVGILYDHEGHDRYWLRNKKQAIGQGYGGFSPQRGIGSIGLLFDIFGDNTFSQFDSSQPFLTQGRLGLAILCVSNSFSSNSHSIFNPFQLGQFKQSQPTGQIFNTHDILKAGGDPKLGGWLKTATSYGDTSQKVKKRKQAKTKLKKLPARSYPQLIPWVLRSDVMARVLLDELILEKPDDWLPHLRQAIHSPYAPIQNLAAYWLGEKGTSLDVSLFFPLLHSDLTRPSALLALSKQKTISSQTAKKILPYLKSSRELERTLAVKIIAQSELLNRHQILFSYFNDPDWNVRKETHDAFQTFPTTWKQWAKLHQSQLNSLGRYWLNLSYAKH
ncbi:MAG: hypothetical protein K1X66_01130 [Verrucomicrobiae bacterium]|nr:hypothetical protein [Verrucomicrobiae bacterium]